MSGKSNIGFLSILSLAAVSMGAALLCRAKRKKRKSCSCTSCTHKGEVKKVADNPPDSFDPAAMKKKLKVIRKPVPLKNRLNKPAKMSMVDKVEEARLKKEKNRQLRSMGRLGSEFVKTHHKEIHQVKTRPKSGPDPLGNYAEWLRKEYDITQVTIQNTSTSEKQIRLWGANKDITTSPPAPEEVEDLQISSVVTVPVLLGAAVHPMGVAHNPANGLTYVTNQLSNNVTVINDSGEVIKLIQLEPNGLPGANSPVAIAVNTKPSSANYGRVYVCGSVANTVTIIDLSLNVAGTIPTGNRPLGIAFNPGIDRFIITNYADDTLSVIDAENEVPGGAIPSGPNPFGIAYCPINDNMYVTNQGNNTVTTYDAGIVATFDLPVGNEPTHVAFFPPTGEMIVVNAASNTVTPIDPVLFQVQPSIAVGNNPSAIAFNPANNYLYIGNRDDETITVIAPDKSIRATLSLGGINHEFAFNTSGSVLFIPDTQENAVNVIGYQQVSSSILISGDYNENNENFSHSPALVKHVRFVLSGDERFKVLTLREEPMTGSFKDIPVSFGNYHSPQNFLNVAELNGLEGSIIDGVNSWLFRIAGLQTITVLVYYRQLDLYHMLPQKTAVAAGAERGKPAAKNVKKQFSKKPRKRGPATHKSKSI